MVDPEGDIRGMGIPSGSSQSTERQRQEMQALQDAQRRLRERLSLTRHPLLTLKYFCLAVFEYLNETLQYLQRRRLTQVVLVLFGIAAGTCWVLDVPQHKYIHELVAIFKYAVWWILLGIASSIGLGSGLHTFVLYLGPHIAAFVMKATQCGRVDIKQAMYDTAQWHHVSSWAGKTCENLGPPAFPHFPSEHGGYKVPILTLLRQVQVEAVLWGLGTALGELPPYFVSRAARLSGERVKELEDLDRDDTDGRGTLMERAQRFIFHHAKNFGFFTILLFASVPNPLFDLAGITCGHFLVPFAKFFSATLIGKAIIKTHIQTFFIILVFNAASVERVERALQWAVKHAPGGSDRLVSQVLALFDKARDKFTEEPNGNSPSIPQPKATSAPLSVSTVWNTVVTLMLVGFLGSIVTSTARSYLFEKHKAELLALASKQKEAGKDDSLSEQRSGSIESKKES